jgi:hypothetical protein
MTIDCTSRRSVDLLQNESDPEQFVDGVGASAEMVDPIVKVGPGFYAHLLGELAGEPVVLEE